MKEKRYDVRQLILAALGGFFGTLVLLTLILWLLVGSEGLALLGGWGVVRARFVGDYEPSIAADAALDGLVTGLGDRWSYYVGAEGYQSLEEHRSNSYVGIGVSVAFTDERGLVIVAVQKDGPADRAGLLSGEVITAVDGASIAGEERYNGSELIRGEAGTVVRLTVIASDGSEREVNVTRAALHVEIVKSELLEENGKKIGYVALSNFDSDAARDFNAAVDALVDQGAEGFVFDMRNNGGGYVTELTKILDHLLPEGPIFRWATRSGRTTVTKSDAACIDLPMAVLVNGDTYSAAELFAAQLQESVGAAVVGEETSGKGYSQQTFPLPNGGALNISTGKYTTGGGVSLVGTGVALDAEVALTDEEALLLRAGRLEHDMDPQLTAALEYVK